MMQALRCPHCSLVGLWVKLGCGWAGGEIGMEMGFMFDNIWAGTGRAGLELGLELKRDVIGWGRSWIQWLG